MAQALSEWRAMRSGSVFSPRRVSQASNGVWMQPVAFWKKRILSARASSRVRRAPPTVALCPSMYLVVE